MPIFNPPSVDKFTTEAYVVAYNPSLPHRLPTAIIFYKSHFWKPTLKSHFLFSRSGFLSGFLGSGFSQKTHFYKIRSGILSGFLKVGFLENYDLRLLLMPFLYMIRFVTISHNVRTCQRQPECIILSGFACFWVFNPPLESLDFFSEIGCSKSTTWSNQFIIKYNLVEK